MRSVKKKDGLPSFIVLMEKRIKTLRRENNKTVEEGIKKLRKEIIKLWRRRREIKIKRERGK